MAEVGRIVCAAYAPWVAAIGRKPAPMGDDYAARIAAGQVHLLETRAGPVGVLVVSPEPDAMLLDSVAVDPEAQGAGHGWRLIAHVEALARAGGYGTIRLYANAAMERNRALHARLGYRETQRAVQDGFNRVFMSKRLDPA